MKMRQAVMSTNCRRVLSYCVEDTIDVERRVYEQCRIEDLFPNIAAWIEMR
jgi:hypothetical protein